MEKNPADEVKSTMWGFLMTKGQTANVSALKEVVYDLTGMIQKTVDQRVEKNDMNWSELGMAMLNIVVKATALVLSGELDEKGKWIPVGERLPREDRWVMVVVKRHHWISDLDELFPDEERIDHPERIYCTLGRCLGATMWEYVDLEADDECVWTSLTDDCSVECLGYPMTEVIAWMPLPEVYKGAV